MKLMKKRGLSIALVVIIALILLSLGVLNSSLEKFVMLDINKVSIVDDPALKTVIKATEECNNRLEPVYKKDCYAQVAWNLGYHYGDAICEKLKQEFKRHCYKGYGRKIGEKYSPDTRAAQNACSKTDFYEDCLSDAAVQIGKESSEHIETEQCPGFEQESVKQRCYDGIGRQLATDNKKLSLCERTEDKEMCLVGFAYVTDKEKREETLSICQILDEEKAKRCYSIIGLNNQLAYKKNVKEAFKDCEKYDYPEECKRGVAGGVAFKFFEEKQENKELIPSTFITYKTTKPSAKVINSGIDTIIRSKLNSVLTKSLHPYLDVITLNMITSERVVGYVTFMLIILSPLWAIGIILVSRNKKTGKIVKKIYFFSTKSLTKLSKELKLIAKVYQEIVKVYQKLKLIIRDVLSIDKTVITSFFKELKSELRSKEGKKRILFIALISGLALLLLAGNINLKVDIAGKSFVAATAGQSCNATAATTGTHCGGHDHGVAGEDLPVWDDCCDINEVCCDVSAGTCTNQALASGAGACYNKDGVGGQYDFDNLQGSCTADWQCNGDSPGLVCLSQLYGAKTVHTWVAGTQNKCCGDDGGAADTFFSGGDGVQYCNAGTAVNDDTWSSIGWQIDGANCTAGKRIFNSSAYAGGAGNGPWGDGSNYLVCDACDSAGGTCANDTLDNLAEGICASTFCDIDETCTPDDTNYYDGCSNALCGYADKCDTNVTSLWPAHPAFIADGVCGQDVLGSGPTVCCTDFAANNSANNQPNDCSTETNACSKAASEGSYCDDVSDTVWDTGNDAGDYGNKFRCDRSETQCVSCAANNTDLLTVLGNASLTGNGLCELGCGAISQCDEQVEWHNLSSCTTTGYTYFADSCGDNCLGADSNTTCIAGSVLSGCTATDNCHGVENATVSGVYYCTMECLEDVIPVISSPKVRSTNAPAETTPSYHNETLNISYVITDTDADEIISYVSCFGNNETGALPSGNHALNITFGGSIDGGSSDSLECTNSSPTSWNGQTCEASLSGSDLDILSIALGNFTCKFYVDDGNQTRQSNEDTTFIEGVPYDPNPILNFTYDNVNYTNESMWCEFNISDPDFETQMYVNISIINNTADELYVEQWLLPSVPYSDENMISFEINETNFTKGDFVICQVQVCDDADNCSRFMNSSSLEVLNYPVKISDPLGNLTIDEDFTNFTLDWSNNYTDADDAMYYREAYINWTFFMSDTEIIGIVMDNDSNVVDIGSLANASGQVEVNWTVVDASGATYNETVYWTISEVDDAPFPVLLDTPLNETNHSTMPEFAWSNTTDVENNDTYYILQIDNDPTFSEPPTVTYYNGSIKETANTTKDVSVGESITTDGKYFWRVLSSDLNLNATACDNPPCWSEVRYFTYDATAPTIALLSPGNNSVIYTKNIEGVEGATLSINFTVDDPTFTDTTSNAWWINLSGVENQSDLDGKFQDIEWDWEPGGINRYTINVTDWGPSGFINVTVWANDSSGNVATKEWWFTINNDAPSLIWLEPDDAVVTRSPQNITVNVTTLGDINYTWLDIKYPNGSSINITMSNYTTTEFFHEITLDYPDGSYEFIAYSNTTIPDPSEVGATDTIRTIPLDNTPPTVNLGDMIGCGITWANDSWSKCGSIDFYATASDANTIINCTLVLNDTISDTYTVAVSDTAYNNFISATLADGNFNWTFNCTDRVNNMGTNESFQLINIDVSFPQFEWWHPSENGILTKNQTVNLTITDVITGINHTWLEVNNTEGVQINNLSLTFIEGTDNYTYEWDTLLYADGAYTINIYANDSAENENITIRTVKIDNSGPNITLEALPNNTVVGPPEEGAETADVRFEAIVWDISTINNCSIILNDQVNYTITGSIPNNSKQASNIALTEGTYNWTFNCTDEVNNIGENRTVWIVSVDLTAPAVTVTVPEDPLEFYMHNASVNWSIIEENLVDNYTDVTLPNNTDIGRYYENLTEEYELSAQDNLTLLGTYTVTTYAEDQIGRKTTSIRTFTVQDTIAPDLILVSPENGSIQNSSAITFGFNTSDYHSVANCTLWLNQEENYTNTTITNDITVTQNLNLTHAADGENISWNVTCYDNSSNWNNTEEAVYIDIDTTPPLIDFINPTDANNSYANRNSTYLNVSITESHNDTFVLVWNYTTNYTNGIEEIIITPDGDNIIFYEKNITNLTEGIYEYYIFSNDTLSNVSTGHGNTSEVRTITIDETPPSAFELLDPSDNVELTDDTPAFNWQDSTDINFDNYSLEISTDESFATVNSTFNSNTSYYALQESAALSTGTWYWRAKAIDKANNQRTSTSTYSLTISNVSLPTQYIQGPGGGGGGGGGKKIVYGTIDIIQPGMQTIYEGETITTPLVLKNTGEKTIRGITLKATTDSPAIELDLSKTYIEALTPGQEEIVELKIIAKGVVGQYEIKVQAEVREPTITDQAKFYVNLIGFGLGKKTIVEEKLRFVGKLFESNPECLELNELVEEAKKELAKKDYDQALELIETSIKSCEELVKTAKKKRLEKPAEPKRTLQILIAEILFFLFMVVMIYRYYKKRSYKGPIVMKRRKRGAAMIILLLIFVSGFFFLKTYTKMGMPTGFTMFEDTSAADFSLGTFSNTWTEGGPQVLLTSGQTLGNFTSRVFNANFTVEWQTINWSWQRSTAGDNITMDIRTSFDNITWSSWDENVTNDSKITDAKNIWTNEEDFIGIFFDTNITNQTGNLTLHTNCSGYNETGTFESVPLDLGFVDVNITTIEFIIANASSEDNTTIETATSADNTTWEDWQQANVSGDQVFSTDNRFFKWKATLITNDTEITPALEDLTVNYERNSTYIQYRATLSTDDNTKTPYLQWVNITYEDASIPLFEFLSPTEENNTYTTNNHTYINFTVSEPNNDSFYVLWNGTQYNYTAMNETATVSEGIYIYALNLTEILEGSYEYYIWMNDTYGHENQTATKTITIDQTAPPSFNLLNPSDGNRSTDDTPFLLWEDCNETNLDNYTIEFSTDTSFTSISRDYYNTSANYQIQNSENLSTDGTYYWRVTAYDKVGYNYTTEYFTYHLGYQQETAYAPGTAGEGGGGGKAVERRQIGLEIIKPSALSFFANRQIIVPLLLENTGTEILQDITLTAESSELDLELKNNYFPVLRPKEEIDPELVINPVEDPGRYNILVKAKVTDPELTDSIMFFIDIVEFGSGNKTEAQDKLTFVVDFIRSHDECAELEKYIIDAQEAFKKNEFDKVLELTDKALQSCKDLVSAAKEKKLEKKKRPAWQYYLPIIESIVFLLIFSGIYSYYKRLKFKRRRHW